MSKSKCTKHTIVGPLLEVEMSKNCTPSWPEAHFEVKMYKAHHCRTTLRCQKSARRCGAKHISKSKCTKHTIVGPLLEVEMSKKCSCGAKHISKSKVQKTEGYGVRSTFGRSDVVSRGRCKGLCTLSKVSKTRGFCSIFNYNHHYTTLHSNTLHYNYKYNYTFTTFHYTTLHCAPLHYTTLHSITLNYTTLHYTTLHYTPLHYATFHYTTLPSTTLHYITLHYATTTTTQLHSTTLHYTKLHYTTLHYTTLHYTTFHYTPLHYITLHYTE